MDFNETTRNELYNNFKKSHKLGLRDSLSLGAEAKDIIAVFTESRSDYTDKQVEIYERIEKEFVGPFDPAEFLKGRYNRVVEFCAGSKGEAAILYKFFDKMNQFPYTTGWYRRVVRSEIYYDPLKKVKDTLCDAFHLQIFDCTLDKYLLDEMSEELVDFKNKFKHYCYGFDNIIAAHLDAGDKAVKKALIKIITSENNTAFLTLDMIRGIIKSDDSEMHELLCKLLVAARLQEGLRQSICENMDCGTIGAFRAIFKTIDENDLLRYSAVRRAVATFIGILDPENLVRSSNKVFNLMKKVVFDKSEAYDLIGSEDAVSIMVGIWGLGFYEVEDAVNAMTRIAETGTKHQKTVALQYNSALGNRNIQQRVAKKFVETDDFDIEIAAGIFSTYMSDLSYEISEATATGFNSSGAVRPINLKLWFESDEEAKKHLAILMGLLDSMEKKKYQFYPYALPWGEAKISRSDVIIRICAIANGLRDEALMDRMAEMIPELDGEYADRRNGVNVLMRGHLTPKRRAALIAALADRETYTRKTAFEIAEKIRFTPEEYNDICGLLRYKASDLRLNVISLIKKQDGAGLERSLNILLTSKKEEMRAAGLDILKSIASGDASIDKKVIEHGCILARKIPEPSEREQIIMKEIPGLDIASEIGIEERENRIYTDDDKVVPKQITFDDGLYPVFDIKEKRLRELFTKLDDLIDKYKNHEIKTAYGETVLLDNCTSLPRMKHQGTYEEVYPLMDVWTDFCESEIKTKGEILAMAMAVTSNSLPIQYGKSEVANKAYNQYLDRIAREVFGDVIVDFDPLLYKHGKPDEHHYGPAMQGGDLFYDIIKIWIEFYCDDDCLYDLGRKVAEYLCCRVPEDKQIAENGHWYDGTVKIATPLDLPIFYKSAEYLDDKWANQMQFENRWNILLVLRELYLDAKDKNETYGIYQNRPLILNSIDYAVAGFYNIISEQQMYYCIFETGNLKKNVYNLSKAFRAKRDPGYGRDLAKYGIENNEKLESHILKVAHTVSEIITEAECKRGDSFTPYSNAVDVIDSVYGVNHLVDLLKALGKDKFVRKESYTTDGSRKTNLSHLIKSCHPLPQEGIEEFRAAVDKSSIGEKRLIELAMYAPQWIDLVEEYLGFEGLKLGSYYFMAHMNDQYNRDERKAAIIARFTHLEKEELLNGAFDIDWFEESYKTLGEKRFKMLYDAAKYSSDGSRHTRARKYADAALGKVDIDEIETLIKDKRNKDLLMSYPLIPIKDNDDMLHRYEFIQNFRKESKQFGSMRRSSEGLACDMALRNLATRAGFKDVTRLTLVMEMALIDSLKGYFEWESIDDGKNTIDVRIQISDTGKTDVAVRKGEKKLASIPASFKKHPYILQIKESNKTFREQYKRTVSMFELSMEERDIYTIGEVCSLKDNPVICPIIDNLVFICDDTGLCGTARIDGEAGLINENGEVIDLLPETNIRVAHPIDLYKNKTWSGWQRFFFDKQQKDGSKQPFRQVFREVYVKLDEEADQNKTRMFAGYQIQPVKTAAMLKKRRWIADYEDGLEKVFYRDDIAVNLWAVADWFSPSDIEPPTLEYVEFTNRKTFDPIALRDVPDIVYSEVMRDVDLVVSVAHAGGVDPVSSHSTIEMRKVIAQCNIELFGLENVTIEGTHAFINGAYGEYTVHLGSGVVHMRGVHQLNVLPVQSQHRGKIFLPFLDEDPKTSEIISKILLFADDKKIKDPYILEQMK